MNKQFTTVAHVVNDVLSPAEPVTIDTAAVVRATDYGVNPDSGLPMLQLSFADGSYELVYGTAANLTDEIADHTIDL